MRTFFYSFTTDQQNWWSISYIKFVPHRMSILLTFRERVIYFVWKVLLRLNFMWLSFGSSNIFRKCSSCDFEKYFLPCKHMFAIFNKFSDVSYRRFTLVRKTENGTFFPLVGHVLTKSGFFTIFHARKTSRFQRKKNEVEIFQLFPFPRAESR